MLLIYSLQRDRGDRGEGNRFANKKITVVARGGVAVAGTNLGAGN